MDPGMRRRLALEKCGRPVEKPIAQHGAARCDHRVLVGVEHRPGAGPGAPGYALGKETRSVRCLRGSQEIPSPLAPYTIVAGEEIGKLLDLVRQIRNLMNDEIRFEVFDR